MNHAYEYYLLAERYGWTHSQILELTRAEALYYLAAPLAFEKHVRRRRVDRGKV